MKLSTAANATYTGLFDPGAKRDLVLLFLLAMVVTVINALKPLHIDDTWYFWVAQHIATNPLDPYNVEIFWFQQPEMAHKGYIPPLLLYWLALSISAFGDSPFMLKLAMLPFVVIFVSAIYALGKRISPALALPLAFFLALSPATLPGWNIMLDLPSIALGLIAVVTFMKSVDNNSKRYAIAAAILASAAVLTKYTALVFPGVLLLYSLIGKRPLYGLGAGLIVLLAIVVWECFYYSSYGHTQLLWSVLRGYNKHDGIFGQLDYLSAGAFMTLGALFPLLFSVYFPLKSIDSRFIYIAVASIAFVFTG